MTKELIKQKIKGIKLKYESSTDINKHINILIEIVALRNGSIKEGEVYINNKTQMIFVDKLGNEFKTTPNGVKMVIGRLMKLKIKENSNQYKK